MKRERKRREEKRKEGLINMRTVKDYWIRNGHSSYKDYCITTFQEALPTSKKIILREILSHNKGEDWHKRLYGCAKGSSCAQGRGESWYIIIFKSLCLS
jgi:hypothetical protein